MIRVCIALSLISLSTVGCGESKMPPHATRDNTNQDQGKAQSGSPDADNHDSPYGHLLPQGDGKTNMELFADRGTLVIQNRNSNETHRFDLQDILIVNEARRKNLDYKSVFSEIYFSSIMSFISELKEYELEVEGLRRLSSDEMNRFQFKMGTLDYCLIATKLEGLNRYFTVYSRDLYEFLDRFEPPADSESPYGPEDPYGPHSPLPADDAPYGNPRESNQSGSVKFTTRMFFPKKPRKKRKEPSQSAPTNPTDRQKSDSNQTDSTQTDSNSDSSNQPPKRPLLERAKEVVVDAAYVAGEGIKKVAYWAWDWVKKVAVYVEDSSG